MTAFELVTPRLILRDFTPPDEAAFVAYQADPALGRSLVQRFAAWRQAEPRLNFQLAICRRDEVATLIGCCGLRGEGLAPGVAEYGLELAPAWQGRYRYAIEITDAMFDMAFRTLHLDEIVSRTTEANERVHRLARWFGATLVVWGDGKAEWRFSRAGWHVAPRSVRRGGRSTRQSPD